jgi:hypothetical protein
MRAKYESGIGPPNRLGGTAGRRGLRSTERLRQRLRDHPEAKITSEHRRCGDYRPVLRIHRRSKSPRKQSRAGISWSSYTGSPGERFVYIDIGTYAGQTDTSWSRRLKIPLSGITWDVIDKLSDHSRPILEACVSGTAKDGGPNCGTAKLLDGWKLTSDLTSTGAVT